MASRPYDVCILPLQAQRIADVAAETGGAVGLSQSGSTLTIHTADARILINAEGEDIKNPDQEHFLC